MDAPLLAPHDLIRPWRRATFVAGAVAAIELVVLVAVGAYFFAKPLSHLIRQHAVAVAAQTASTESHRVQVALKHQNAPAGRARPRSHVKIMVLNGNGIAGAASTAATRLHGLGYKIAGTANARRQDYASSVVMYRPGFRAEGLRLAHDLGVRVVGPLDGIRLRSLDGGELAVILGA